MIDITKDIDSLSNFKRNTSKYIKQISKSGSPIVLTVNGKAKLVVQDAKSYQNMVELIERAEAIQGIHNGLEDTKNTLTISLKEFKDEMSEI